MPTNATMVAADGAWTIQSLNTAIEGRYTIGALLAQANQQNSSIIPTITWRSGVLPSSSWGSQIYDLIVAPQATPSLSLQVYPGACVIPRAGQGPYLCYNTSIKSVAVDTGNATNPRRDLIVARVYDSAIGDSQTAFALEVVTGTPAASPSDPSVPTGAIPLARISVAANATTITSGNITDLRTSTSAPGAVRPLLGGDTTSLTSDGYMTGELRFRKAVGSLPDLIDYWGTDGTWHTLNDSMVCRIQLGISSVALAAGTDVWAQANWTAVEDPYSMAHLAPGAGTFSYIQVPIAGRYRVDYLTSMNPASGACLAEITKNSAATGSSLVRDNRTAVTAGGDGTWCHASREVPLAANDKVYWGNWSSVACNLSQIVLNVPTEMSVRRIGA